MPSSIDLEAKVTQHWLFSLGNWTVYAAPGPVVAGWPDPFRTKPDPLIAWMVEQEVSFLVDSFHDDTDWLVAIPGSPPGL